MVRIRTFLTLILALHILACNETNYRSSEESYTEAGTDWLSLRTDQFEIEYPNDWKLDQSGQMGTRFFLYSPVVDEDDPFTENVNLVIQDLRGYDMDLDQFVEVSLDQINTLATDGKILSSDRKKQGSQEFHQLIYTAKQGIFALKFEQRYWVIGEEAFVLTFTSEEEEFEPFQDTAEKIFSSFTLK